MKFKRMCAVILIGVMCLASGCGKEEGKSKGDKGNRGNSGGDSYFDSVPAELEGTTVKFATWINHRANESAAVLDDFTNLTGIEVELVSITQSEYISKLTSLISAGQSPDVVVNNGEFPNILQVLQPLDGTKLDTSDSFWDQAVVKLGTIGGRPYLVNAKNSAWNMASPCVYYNNKIFEDNGITTPALYLAEGRWTLDNFYKCARELAQVCSEVGAGIETSAYFSTYASGMAKYDSATETFTSNLTDSAVTKVWQDMIKARENGSVKVNDEGGRHLFVSGKMGMIFTGAYGLRKYGWMNDMDINDLSFVTPPRADSGSEEVYGGSMFRSYGICKGASNADGAAYFLRYFLNADNYEESELYKNDEAAELYKKLSENQNYNNPVFDYGIMSLMATTSLPLYEIFPDLADCSSAQVTTALNAGANKLNSCITRANMIINDVKEQNKK
ncbi:MAG TPA: hypothetical protein DCY23_06235 [Ruminococcaceae bacterium]|nr:hypothetical protein [Oscillospiraceae bacterium]